MKRAFGIALLALSLSSAQAQEPPKSSPGEIARHYFGDIELIDQNGHTVRLSSDLLKDRVVVINVFFTECTGACPLMARTFAAIQEEVGDRLGKDVLLISLSVDPKNDTPEKLAAYALRFKARPGWVLLTGSPENVALALKKLGQTVEDRNDHTNLFFIGNLRTGLWKKVFGLAPPQEVVKAVQTVLDDRG
jgi:protein SCO1/2